MSVPIQNNITFSGGLTFSKVLYGNTAIFHNLSISSYVEYKGSEMSTNAYLDNLIVPGPLGQKGDTGSQGIRGETGLYGDRGIQGFKGEDGLKGDSGPKGIQGETGFRGNTGLPGIQGSIGLRGMQGLIGLQGDTGLKGIQGPIGIDGLQGIQGDTGEKGDMGLQGVLGPTGLSLQGSQGLEGPKGIRGVSGKKGDTGPDGLSPQGILGPTGKKGDTGLQGLIGLTGDTGLVGSIGKTDVGPTGKQGIQGPTGPTGPTGSTGLSGLTITNNNSSNSVYPLFAANTGTLTDAYIDTTYLSYIPSTGVFSYNILNCTMIQRTIQTEPQLIIDVKNSLILTNSGDSLTLTLPNSTLLRDGYSFIFMKIAISNGVNITFIAGSGTVIYNEYNVASTSLTTQSYRVRFVYYNGGWYVCRLL